MVLLHGVARQGLPSATIAEGVESALKGADECIGCEVAETKASCLFSRFIGILNGILEPSRRADDGKRAVAHCIHLVQPAWFVPGRHEKQVGSSVDEMSKVLIEAEARRDTVRVLLRQARPELLVVPIPVAEQDPGGVELHERVRRG